MKKQRSVDVLLVEDNEGDVELVRAALSETRGGINLCVVTDGLEAMRTLRDRRFRPRLIILDLNIPGMSGYDVLREVKADQDLCAIPVVIFTSSAASKDVRTSYELHASSFVRKPADVDDFFAVIAGMERYWTQTATLPTA